MEKEKEHKTDGTKCWCNPRIIKVLPKKYTIKEFFDSLYWEKDNYWFKIVSDINGEVKKIPIRHILLAKNSED